MLSWSSQQSETEVNLVALASGNGDIGLPYADELLNFATAAARLDDDLAEMNEARRALNAAAGELMMIDAAAVAANFHMMTRLADGTGARLPQARMESSAPAIAIMGIADMVSRR
ncbi:MAG: hypothetical protein ACXV3B_10630 [Ilumatobacteraceae bacterium]